MQGDRLSDTASTNAEHELLFEFQPYCCSSLLPSRTVLASLSSSVLHSGVLDLMTSPTPLGFAMNDKGQPLLRKGSPNHDVGTMLSEISEPTHMLTCDQAPHQNIQTAWEGFKNNTLTECQPPVPGVRHF